MVAPTLIFLGVIIPYELRYVQRTIDGAPYMVTTSTKYFLEYWPVQAPR